MALSKDKQQQSKSPKKRKKEKLSRKDIEEMMGMNRDRYGRGKGGAMRRK